MLGLYFDGTEMKFLLKSTSFCIVELHPFLSVTFNVTNELPDEKYDAVILAVAHKEFADLDVRSLVRENGVVYDVKGVLDREIVDARL